MKRLFFFCFLLAAQVGWAQEISIIPQPVNLQVHPGKFAVSNQTTLVVRQAADRQAAAFFNDYLQEIYGFKLKVKKKASKNYIRLATGNVAAGNPKDGYSLLVQNDGITIEGQTAAGTFYGIQTLIQLLPVEKSASLVIAAVTVQDYPRFAYRGLHLDVGRHLFPVSFIKKYIDYLALHKMNNFHWHLTEDQGWRIEIKKYPKLTEIGGFRNGTILGRYPGTGNTNKRYGGYYTQEEVKEVVKYAAARHINVIPEIELPGHSSAALTAYPELGCPGTGPYKVEETWGVFDDVYCAGNDATFAFLQEVLDEVMALFPSKYIHIGGDESPKANWKICSLCQKRIKDNNLKDEHELQSYFIQRMEKYLNGKGRTIIGWDEILEGGLAPNAVVMSWRGEEGGIAAAKENHYVIMTPGSHVYFDHSQSQREDSVTIGGYTSVEKTYSYEPIPKELNAQQAKYVLGAQANVWTEYMNNPAKVEYQLFPRLSALSEVLWLAPEKKSWPDFERRLMTQFKRYDLWGARYSHAYYDIKADIVPDQDNQGVALHLEGQDQVGKLFYTVNGQPAQPYTGPVKIKETQKITGLYFKDEKLIDSLTIRAHINKATGRKITLKDMPSPQFPGRGAFTLVDGITNESGGRTRQSVGYSGSDVEAVVDLGTSQSISRVVLHAFHAGGKNVYPPKGVEVYASRDGISYTRCGTTDKAALVKGPKSVLKVDFAPATARFVKVVVKNQMTVPEGNKGAGEKTWLLLDELEIN